MKKSSVLLAIMVAAANLVLVTQPASARHRCFVADPIWRAQHARTEALLIQRTTELGVTVSDERSTTAENLLAAIQVFTKQTSADGEKEQAMVQASSEAFAATATEQHRRERLAEIREQFGPETGNGVSACETVEMVGGVVRAIDAVEEEASRNVGELDIGPGKVTPNAQAVELRLKPDSTDASVLLDPHASEDVKNRVISQLAGFPVPKPDATIQNTSAGDIMLLRARRVEALRSPALVSLSAVAAMSSDGGHSGAGGAASVVEQMDMLIDQYGGGPRYGQWTDRLSAQSERGLIIELTRLRALHLRLSQVSNDQDARLAAVFATMVATKVGGDL